MSRRRAAVKREVQPDPKFGDNVVTKFMNCLMHEGKKSVAEHIVYGAFDRIQKRSGQDPIRVVLDNPAVPIRERNPRIPKRLAEVIDDALIDKPGITVSSAAELSSALRYAL